MKKKTLALLLATVLIVGGVIGVTVAWLLDSTAPVVNTFTSSDIGITLEETAGLDFKMIPGHTIAKDPKVTVADGSEDAWLFVKVDTSDSVQKVSTGGIYTAPCFILYEIATGWTPLDDNSGVYYRQVKSAETTKTFSVLLDDKVTVPSTLKKEEMKIGDIAFVEPTLTVTAYATQLYKTNGSEFTPAEAWALAEVLP